MGLCNLSTQLPLQNSAKHIVLIAINIVNGVISCYGTWHSGFKSQQTGKIWTVPV